MSSPARSISPGFPIQRGRESPFPVNPTARVDERLQQRTALLAEARNQQHPYAAVEVRPRPGYRSLAPPEIYIDAASDDGQSIMSHPDVDSVLGVFKGDEGPMIVTDSDPDDDDSEIERSSAWARSDLMERNGEARARFIRNAEGMYGNGGRGRGGSNGMLGPSIPPRSILRNGVSTRV